MFSSFTLMSFVAFCIKQQIRLVKIMKFTSALLLAFTACFLLCVSVEATPSREGIISCAQDWCNRQVPYCQCNGAAECCGSCPYCGTTRCDCSGFVSACFGFSTGYTTFTLPKVTHPIAKDDLQIGDIMLCVSDHVVFFGGWTDSSMSNYVVYQEPGCHTAGPHYAFKSVTPYPFNWNPTCFQPYRLNGLGDETTCKTNMASKEVLMDAFFNPASFPLKHAKEALAAQESVNAHRKSLGM
ncbi:Hypothetical protein, putative [Bodo saltans]|uniref:Uncharacterized protein n=1 Tax=Bodo saltans TaxID=75058 RepID=A0A0S4IX44_BODSA|nr:Hypothetical protein, putative [Bodo saltans]|eukprot:CUG06241.1 Hypothetical protein, putative [Bodo saltans]